MVSSLMVMPSSFAIGCQTLVRWRSCVVPPQETMVTVLSSAACVDEKRPPCRMRVQRMQGKATYFSPNRAAVPR